MIKNKVNFLSFAFALIFAASYPVMAETVDQRFKKIQDGIGYKEGACYAMLVASYQNGVQLEKKDIDWFAKNNDRYLIFGDLAQQKCASNIKSNADLDRYFACLSKNSKYGSATPNEIDFYIGAKTWNTQNFINKFGRGSRTPISMVCYFSGVIP